MADHPIPYDSESGRRIVEITPNWLVGDVLRLFPGAASILDRHFMAGCPEHPGCTGCPGRFIDSVEEAAWLSGAEDHLEELLAELNESYRQWLAGEAFWGVAGSA
jgi:hypothetical protein